MIKKIKILINQILIQVTLLTLTVVLYSCAAPEPLLPKIPTQLKPQAQAPKQKQVQRVPSANNTGDLAAYAIKGDFNGEEIVQDLENTKPEPCQIKALGWGNDGSRELKEYQEFKVNGFDSTIQSHFWAKAVDRSKNSFNSKFVLVATKTGTPQSHDKVVLNIFLDEDQKNILGYIFVLDQNEKKILRKCKINQASAHVDAD